MSTDEHGAEDAREPERFQFAEEFGLVWEQSGGPRMEGRVLGYLMMTPRPYVSLADLATALNASSGSVSTTTRRLLETGFIKRHVIPGDRSYYFRADDDIWGSWLAGERKYLASLQQLFEIQLDTLGDDPTETAARTRLQNGRDYMEWVIRRHRSMLEDWKAFKAGRETEAPPSAEEDT